ncbi:hypothetical protein ACWCPT_23050 [Streptomyces sp. NPDC002308]
MPFLQGVGEFFDPVGEVLGGLGDSAVAGLLRLFSAAAQLVTTARRRHLRFARHWPWTDVITTALDRLDVLPNPG